MRHHRRGFSLAEMMVAIGILGIGLVMVACFFPVALYQHADTTAQTNAMRLARHTKEIVLQSRLDPNNPLGLGIGNYLGYTMPGRFNPESHLDASNVIWPPEPPYESGLGSPFNPRFDDTARYISYPFGRRIDPDTPGAIQYFIVVIRRLPGQRFPGDWGMSYQAYAPRPLLFISSALVIGSLDGLAYNGDPYELAGPEPPAGWRMIDLVPPNGKLISLRTWATYTVVSKGADPDRSIRLREELRPEDKLAGQSADGAPFVVFPPALQDGQLDGKCPIVMVLYF